MNAFINKYDHQTNNFFYRFVATAADDELFIVGGRADRGYLAKLDGQGRIRWEYTYAHDNRRCALLHGQYTTTGDVLALGYIETGQHNRRNYWLLSIDPDGEVRYSREIFSARSRTALRLLQLPGDRGYIICGWYNHTDGKDRVEMIHVDRVGQVAAGRTFHFGRDDQLSDAIVLGDQLLLAGMSGGSDFSGFLILSDSSLKISLGFITNYLPTGQFEQIDALYALDNTHFIAVGDAGNDFYLVKGRLDKGELFLETPLLANTGWDCGIRTLKQHKGLLYVLGWNKKNVRQQFVAVFDPDAADAADARVAFKTFDIEEEYYLVDLVFSAGGLLICGFFRQSIFGKHIHQALLIRSDLELETCRTVGLEAPPAVFSKKPLAVQMAMVQSEWLSISRNDQVVQARPTISEVHQLCPSGAFPVADRHLLQSPWIHLQAVGSLGRKSTYGVLTRWWLRRELGDNHLPKGDYALNHTGYNRPGDFVNLYRAPYSNSTKSTVDISFSHPPQVINDAERLWVYRGRDDDRKIFYLRFLDAGLYQQLKGGLDPQQDAAAFVGQYSAAIGLFELEFVNGLCFAVAAEPLVHHASFKVEIETFSAEGNPPPTEQIISNRLVFQGPDPIRVVGENMKRFRFRIRNGSLPRLRLEFYQDFFRDAVDFGFWEKIGAFALTKDEAEAFKQLNDPARMDIGNEWERFNDGVKVNVPLYQQRWRGGLNPDAAFAAPDNTEVGLRYGVEQYLQLSEDPANPQAVESIHEVQHDPANEVLDSMTVSYLDLLNIAALDYLTAGMLGLAYVDTKPQQDDECYLYLIEYRNMAKLPGRTGPELFQHFYMSLPTAPRDQRLPLAVETLPPAYGLKPDGGNSSFPVTDPAGYVRGEPLRFINVTARRRENYTLSNGFFNPAVLFSLEQFTVPVFVGAEYRKKGEPDWREPEIAHQRLFGHTETLPLIFYEDGSKPSLIHQENEEGIHQYVCYPINIFSQAGQLGNVVETDHTKFMVPNKLLPPHNLRVQLIQEEDPLLLTTRTEQELYAAILDGQNLPSTVQPQDKVLLRITFDYCHLHDINYAFGEEVEFVFRVPRQRTVKGGIASIDNTQPLPMVTTTDYTYHSNGQTEQPEIPAALAGNFAGGQLVVNGNAFEIVQITRSGIHPQLTVKPIEKREMVTDGNGNATLVETTVEPEKEPDDLFTIRENLTQAASWDNNVLAFKVSVGGVPGWQNTRIESFRNDDDAVVERPMRGFWEQAVLLRMTRKIAAEGGRPPREESMPGYYRVIFSNFSLAHHPQRTAVDPAKPGWYLGVAWQGGYLRAPLKKHPQKEWKTLKVISLKGVGSSQRLELVVFDESFNPANEVRAYDADHRFKLPMEVNFYPGYEVRLQSEAAAGFTVDTVFPAAGSDRRETLFSARSSAPNPNTGGGPDYYSDIAPPQIIRAEGVITPVPPDEPLGPEYATPQDIYARATYTADIKLNQPRPYALIFYRMDLNALLSALYRRESIEAIKRNLPPVAEDDFFTSRWKSLVRFELEPDLAFKPFPADGFRFPQPDKAGIFDGAVTFPDQLKRVQEAVWNAATPILETPLLYSSITQSKISPAHPAIKLPGDNLRFTDFTLDGEKVTSYFYFAREMGSKYDLSRPGPIAGPVQLIDIRPPAAPVVRKILTQAAGAATGGKPAVKIELSAFTELAGIRKVQLYRSDDALDALTIRTMQLVRELPLDARAFELGSLELIDDFADEAEVPYGEQLFYRVVALRELRYKKTATGPFVQEYIPSVPTKAFTAGLIDVINPKPPEITASIVSNTPTEITRLELSWQKTAYNGKYYLFRMNSTGKWNKVFEIQTNEEDLLHYTFPDPLPRIDEDGDRIYHRFKVTVENVSGLLNLEDWVLTV